MQTPIKWLIATAVLSLTGVAQANTIVIAENTTAVESNFQSPGTTARVGYSITTSDDGTNFYVNLVSTNPNALPFANLYFDTIASTPNSGSNLGFQFGPNAPTAFNPNDGIQRDITGSGVTSSISTLNAATTINVVIPNSFFLGTPPTGLTFTPTTSGNLVSLHLSQSFGYSVVGGSANYPAPAELGDAIVSTATPEPASLALFAAGALTLFGIRKKLSRS